MNDGFIFFKVILPIVIFVCIYIGKTIKQSDPFRYIWDVSTLNNCYTQEKNNNSFSFIGLDEKYQRALKRIKNISLYPAYLHPIIEEAKHVMQRKRSPERLKDTAWNYVYKLAERAGYAREETNKDSFFCPGWNEIWEIYHSNKSRILGKSFDFSEAKQSKTQSHQEFLRQKKSYFQDALSDLKTATSQEQLRQKYETHIRILCKLGESNGWNYTGSVENLAMKALFDALMDTLDQDAHSAYNDYYEDDGFEFDEEDFHKETDKNTKTSAKEKNQQIFDGIWDVKELKKRYYKLARLNHPDHGGNYKAMQLLNEYYYEALKRIQNKEF